MKALTVRQPYASLIAHGIKPWETRTWRTSYRGPVAIHAGQRWAMEHDEAEHEWHGWSNDLCGLCLLGDALGHDLTASEIPLGAVVELVDCLPIVGPVDDDAEPPVIEVDGGTLSLWEPSPGVSLAWNRSRSTTSPTSFPWATGPPAAGPRCCRTSGRSSAPAPTVRARA